MTFTLMLDLDDTLLDTNLEAFIPAYFKALSHSLSEKVAPEKMMAALSAGTQAMLKNLDPGQTLQNVFDGVFFPQLGFTRDELQPVIDRFYDEVFPTLGTATRQIPEAIQLVEWAMDCGFRVGIATNPIFPRKAIEHRLRWAGLAPEKYPFALVSSYETFHFTKEMVSFYPEFMAQLGWPEDPAIMVGDDFEREVKPTRSAGVPVYWVRRGEDPGAETAEVPQGSLASLRAWLEKTDWNMLRLSFQSTSALLAGLRATPAALSSLTRNLPAKSWKARPQPGEWCLTEILCHLRDVEREVDLPRLQKVLAEDNPFIPGEVTDGWGEKREYRKQNGPGVLSEFVSARKETLTLLSALKEEWNRMSRHAVFGPTSLQELVGIMLEHDRTHIQQVWKTIG